MTAETDKEASQKEEEKKKECSQREEDKKKEASHKEEEKKKDAKKDEKKAGKSRTLSYDERSEKEMQLQRLFELPVPEPLVEDFACAYQKSFLRQGRMYVLRCHLAFYSMLGPRLLLGYPAIQAIREAKTLDLFNNAITVTTVDGQTHFFTSFLTRDKALAVLSEAHREHQRANAPDPPLAAELSTTAGLSDAGAESDAGSMRVRSSGSSSDNEGSSQEVAEEQRAENGLEAKGKASKHQRRFKATPPNSISRTPAIQPNPSITSIEEAVNSVGEAGFCPVADILKKPMKMNVSFPKGVRLEDVFAALFDSSSAFFTAYHQRQGDKVVEVQEWAERSLPEGQGAWAGSRQAVFSTEVSMPKRTWVSAYEHHAFYYLQLPETKTLVVQSATRTPEVMYGDCFRAETLLCWREVLEGEVVLDIYCGLHFVKSTMMRRIIESKALAELARSYDLWLEVALGMVTDALACRRPASPAVGSPGPDGWVKRREKKGLSGRKARPSPVASPRSGRPSLAAGEAATAAGTEAAAPLAVPTEGPHCMLLLVAVSLALQWGLLQYVQAEGTVAEHLLNTTEQRRRVLQNETAGLRAELRQRHAWTAQAAAALGPDPAAAEGAEPLDVAALQQAVQAAINVLAPCDGRAPPAAIPSHSSPSPTADALLLLARQQQQLTIALLLVAAGGVAALWTLTVTLTLTLLLVGVGYAVHRYYSQPAT